MVGVDTMNRSSKIDITATDRFPAGLRVLAVDDEPTCLMILAAQLRKCSYEVTMCTRAADALSILRENRDGFDLVISDVYMPDMDGFKLLEYVGLEMDLPVIMTSSHGETSVVMKGVTHGACDYLLKPVRIEELRNIWQHVVRKKKITESSKDVEASGSVEDVERQKRGSDESEYTSSVNDGADGNWKVTKKRKDDDDNDHEYEDPSTLKKQRVVWSVELHQQFVNAVNHLGIDKAVPKKILELMNVQGLTRENVASHLQKYRLYLRRLSGVHPSTPNAGFGDADMRSFAAASGQLSQHALASIQGGLLNRVGGPSHVQSGVGMNHHTPVLMPAVVPSGGFYRSHQPPPLMNIPAARGIDLESSQISPRTPVDEVPVAGLSVLQHQLANVGGIGRAGSSNGNGLLLSPHSNMSMLSGGGSGTGEVRSTPGNLSYTSGLVGDKVMVPFRPVDNHGNNDKNSEFHNNDGPFPLGTNMETSFSGKELTGYPSNGRASFGRTGYQHPVSGDKILPARFAVDGGEESQENANYRVKLEGTGNETDDLFSIILKQQQQQLHHPEGMSGFTDSDYMM